MPCEELVGGRILSETVEAFKQPISDKVGFPAPLSLLHSLGARVLRHDVEHIMA
jgi:hypothetical protein